LKHFGNIQTYPTSSMILFIY